MRRRYANGPSRSDPAREPLVALLVEDDEPVRDLIARMLTIEGFNVVQAANGRAALNRLDEGSNVAVLVTDLLMPVLDGYQLLEAVRTRGSLPSVVMTAGLSLSEEQEKRLGGAPLLYKPFTHESLVEAIRAARFEVVESAYWIDCARKVVHLRANASPPIEEKIAMVNRLWGDPEFRRGFSVLIDRRGHTQTPPVRDTLNFWRYLGSHEVRVERPSAWVVVADRPSLYGFYQGLEETAEEQGVALKVFLDYDVALQWAIERAER